MSKVHLSKVLWHAILRRNHAVRWLGCRPAASAVLARLPPPCTPSANARPGFHYGLAAAAALLLTGVAADSVQAAEAADPAIPLPQQEHAEWHLLDLNTRRKSFFKYEKRIRDLSPPDKCFEYFSTIRAEDGSRHMAPGDLLCSLVAVYPPEASQVERAGALPGERRSPVFVQDSEFFKLFDMGGDGLIGFHEYLLLITLLSIPEKDAKIAFDMFDADDSGTIDLQEFLQVTEALAHRARRHSLKSGLQPAGGATSGEQHGLIKSFFGADGRGQLDLDHFKTFLAQLHREIVRLEFQHYAFTNKGFITGKDFARSLVANVGLSSIDEYMARAESLEPELAAAKVSLEDFMNFALLRQELHALAVALEFRQNTVGKFDKDDFKRAVRKITGTVIREPVVDIVFHMFDTDHNNDLASAEFIRVMKRREGNAFFHKYGLEEAASAPEGLFACLRACITR
ncbi:hypothetical protein WJX72_010159 [[Myrmecia] bisecta]|uniref:EF-hand domain-containing protein n=1 Tax=[Myrmecia] bisecta TaxID=41462 RepID=A0AAW1PYN0_9CHLO